MREEYLVLIGSGKEATDCQRGTNSEFSFFPIFLFFFLLGLCKKCLMGLGVWTFDFFLFGYQIKIIEILF